MADEVAQASAFQGIEAAQAAVLHQQLQIFLCFVLCRIFSPFVTVHFGSSYMFCLSSYCLPQMFLLFPFLYFLVCFVHCCIFAVCVPACYCILFSPLVIFQVLVHSFVPPPIWSVKPSRFYCILFLRVQLAGLRSQEGLLTWAEKPKRSFILYFPEYQLG